MLPLDLVDLCDFNFSGRPRVEIRTQFYKLGKHEDSGFLLADQQVKRLHEVRVEMERAIHHHNQVQLSDTLLNHRLNDFESQRLRP